MVTVELYDAAAVGAEDWRKFQTLQRDAFTDMLASGDRPKRTQAEIDALVEWNDPERYAESHRDPNTEVGRRYRSGQEFDQPRLAVASVGDETVGFGYSANNVSGSSERMRSLKRFSILGHYVWLREVAVAPEHRRQGVARQVARALLERSQPIQPVATYIWPQEITFLQGNLERLGFVPTDEDNARIFGEQSKPVPQVRMQARSAGWVLRRMDGLS